MLFQSAFQISESSLAVAKKYAKRKNKTLQISQARLVLQGGIPKIQIRKK